jgi:hypothetical protein
MLIPFVILASSLSPIPFIIRTIEGYFLLVAGDAVEKEH